MSTENILFQIKQGSQTNLNNLIDEGKIIPGTCYVTTDNGKIHIGMESNSALTINDGCVTAGPVINNETIDNKLVQLKQDDNIIYPLTQYNQVLLEDGTPWDGTLGSKDVFIGDQTPPEEEPLWIDLSGQESEDVTALRSDAIKILHFDIPVTEWFISNDGNYYQHILQNLSRVTAKSCILNLVLDDNSQANHVSTIYWNTDESQIILSTEVQPIGTLKGYMIICESGVVI